MSSPRALEIAHPWSNIDFKDFERDLNRKMDEDRREFDRRMREIDREFETKIEHPPRYWLSKKIEENQSTSRRGSISRQIAEDEELPDKFRWALDVKEFAPEELKVSVVGNTLTLEGDHQEIKDKEGYHSKKSYHFNRKYTVPPSVDLQGIESKLTATGELIVEVPKREALQHDRKIPIDFKSASG